MNWVVAVADQGYFYFYTALRTTAGERWFTHDAEDKLALRYSCAAATNNDVTALRNEGYQVQPMAIQTLGY